MKLRIKCLAFLLLSFFAFPAHAQENFKGELSFSADGETYRIVGLPTFEAYPAEADAENIASDIDWASEKDAWRFRTRLRAGLKGGANFNGHYAVISHGCGTSCQLNWVVDVTDGKVIGTVTTSLGAVYRLNSGLIAADLVDDSTIEELGAASPYLSDMRFYTIDNDKLVLVKSLSVHEEVEKLKAGKAEAAGDE